MSLINARVSKIIDPSDGYEATIRLYLLTNVKPYLVPTFSRYSRKPHIRYLSYWISLPIIYYHYFGSFYTTKITIVF